MSWGGGRGLTSNWRGGAPPNPFTFNLSGNFRRSKHIPGFRIFFHFTTFSKRSALAGQRHDILYNFNNFYITSPLILDFKGKSTLKNVFLRLKGAFEGIVQAKARQKGLIRKLKEQSSILFMSFWQILWPDSEILTKKETLKQQAWPVLKKVSVLCLLLLGLQSSIYWVGD